MTRNNRPRNSGYRLVFRQRSEYPEHPVRVAINPERMGGLMRFVKRYCDPVAKFVEVRNGRRTTVVVVTAESVAERRSALPAVMTCGLYVVAGALNVATAISKAVVIRDTTKGSRNAVVMCGTSYAS
ncbi:hypothetical protein F444_07747, partial [Phytophthora nicotianae P1976]